MRTERGMLIVLSGPSGSGKGTLVKSLLSRRDDTVLSVSMTTRSPRPGEEEGVHYFFRSREEAEEMIARGALLEYAEYNGHYYGTPEQPILHWLEQGKNVLLEIEVQGAEQVMDRRPDLISIFIAPPSIEELEGRLRGRGTETEEAVAGRLKAARQELSRAFRYDYVVLNDEVETAVNRVQAILDAERMRYPRMKNLILEVMEDAETDRH
ncbi:MAG: guanylate kinase [Clostridiales bacterium]|nr:guanylate kinase [Clostridiales bacterium]